MSELLAWSPGIVLVALILYLYVAGVIQKRREAKTPRRCDTCVHFDLEEGLATLRKYPHAFMAYSATSPSQVMQKFDKDGVLLPQEINVSARDDTFENMGACMHHSQLRLGFDMCDAWRVQKLVQIKRKAASV